MKIFISSLMGAALMMFTLSAFADSVIVTQTKTWAPVPITVDSGHHTYTVTGTMPAATSADYYYSYPGYRCFREKREIVGVNAMIFNASISGGSDIYCYAE